MTIKNYNHTPRTATSAPIKMWSKGVSMDENVHKQVGETAQMPFIHNHIAVMPDAHYGMGATVGTVIATKNVLIPAAVGVDIGCGMVAIRTSMTATDLPDDLSATYDSILQAVPTGFNQHLTLDHVNGRWAQLTGNILQDLIDVSERFDSQKIHQKFGRQLGTLGGGNHFIEICISETNDVWIVLHSGSRGVGNMVGMDFITKAKKEMERWHIQLPNQDLAYLPEGSKYYEQYATAVTTMQQYAWLNRRIMMDAVVDAMVATEEFPPFTAVEEAINCHHNYVQMENHHGTNVWLTRKGAVSARKNEMGIIPGSMGAKTFIVRGLGNEDSYCSCSHGAGRVMSRKQAKREITMEEHANAMTGITARLDEEVIDESPRAYKDIDDVMAAQSDLVSIEHTLRQVLNIKG